MRQKSLRGYLFTFMTLFLVITICRVDSTNGETTKSTPKALQGTIPPSDKGVGRFEWINKKVLKTSMDIVDRTIPQAVGTALSEMKKDSQFLRDSLTFRIPNGGDRNQKFDRQSDTWLTDYREACRLGKEQGKMVLVYFYDTASDSPYKAFENESLKDEGVQKKLKNYICVRLPYNATLKSNADGKDDAGVVTAEMKGEAPPKDAPSDISVLSEEVIKKGGKTQYKQTFIRKANAPTIGQASFKSRSLQAVAPNAKNASGQRSFVVPGRDMGSVAQLNRSKMDLSFPNINKTVVLLQEPAFYEMLNTPGIAIIDYEHKNAEFYGDIVSVFPFLNKKPYSVEHTRVMLSLPPGTVTQRSVIFAVRIHPDHPKSTNGALSDYLLTESNASSAYQAKIHLQGHHNWESRFKRINTHLPGELWASEVCAESWPGQHLLESAIECVRCWRYSEGHWSAVVAEHPYYGYDMQLGTNGIWYATGIFGKWRNPAPATKVASAKK
ncbi:MAG: thioredoxin family protein [Planctomycetaceae bacterium]|nr:thioredoxin family protein [Planctomycetaceae bacterium]